MDDTGTLATDDASLSRVSAIEQELARHLDLATAILLSIATVATAWCVYQATGFSGEQTRAYAEASSSRIESTRSYNRSMEVLAIDADLFVQWVAAYNAGDQRLLPLSGAAVGVKKAQADSPAEAQVKPVASR